MGSLVIHIRRRKAAPDACPECGRVEKVPPPNPSLSDLFKASYTTPCWTEAREVPGWQGFKTWYFVCTHKDDGALEVELFRENTLFQRIAKDDIWKGGTIAIPFGRK